jgi:FKBP-type peptidyl-prolyl cis-trans isomerase SlyD
MIIENRKVVSVDYHLTTKSAGQTQESLVEKTSKEHPFVFLFGSGQLLESFEKNLKGKKVGDTFDFLIDSKNGYGERDENHLVNVPIEAFKGEDGSFDDENVKVGSTLPMVDNQGHKLQGLVEEITSEFVKMDFNHPLAGKELHFVGEILEVREASEEEISHGHVHGPGGHHH